MKRFIPSRSMAVAVAALVIAASGSAEAAGIIHIGTRNINTGAVTTGKLRDGSVISVKLHAGSVAYGKLNKALRKRISSAGANPAGTTVKVGPQGPAGPQGATGPQGSTGPTGAAGTTGAAGSNGTDGTDGTDGTNGTNGTNGFAPDFVTSLSSDGNVAAPGWAVTDGTCGGTDDGVTAINGNGLSVTSLPGDNAFGGAQYNPSGITLSDLNTLTYTEKYSGGATDAATPYVEIDLANGDSLNFATYEQPNGGSTATHVWQTWDVTAPDSVLLVNHMPNTETFAQALAADGDQAISDIQVQSGCSAGASGGTSSVSNVYLDDGGTPQVFEFVAN